MPALRGAVAALVCLASWAAAGTAIANAGAELPPSLRETGLFAPDGTAPAPGVAAFTPRYPLWSDGADKRRWISLPPGTTIDASRPDAWDFPPGTKLWKEFRHGDRPVETRFIERRPDGSWRFATYVWNETGTEALLAPARGIAALPVAKAPGGRYAIPARGDCMACHGSAPVPVLGFSAVQLAPGRGGEGAGRRGELGLPELIARGWLRGQPAVWATEPPRIAAVSSTERAALGLLHANCAHCHNTGPTRVPVDLTLAQRAADPAASREEVMRSAVGATVRYRPEDAAADGRAVVPGHPEASVLVLRMRSRDPNVQMPPLGTTLPDAEGLALVHRWIAGIPTSTATSLSSKEP